MAFCSKCGKALNEGVGFCDGCGSNTNGSQSQNIKQMTRFARSLPLFISGILALISCIVGGIGYDNRWSGAAKQMMSYSERRSVQACQDILEFLHYSSFILSAILIVAGIIWIVRKQRMTPLKERQLVKTLYLALTPITGICLLVSLYIILFTDTCYF